VTTRSSEDVSFSDADNGTAVGDVGVILRTTNGGSSWVSQNSGTATVLLGVWVTDANTGTAVGDFGTILKTTDGGNNWVPQLSGTTNDLWESPLRMQIMVQASVTEARSLRLPMEGKPG
jgi:photosystem II stability/assembly factor-like uncharacterized protein